MVTIRGTALTVIHSLSANQSSSAGTGAPYLSAALLLTGAMCVAWQLIRPRMSEPEPAFATVAADSIN